MKNMFFLLLLFFSNIILAQEFPVLKGDYLGQIPPGDVAIPFGLGIISNFASNEHTCSFSPDGKEMYFTRDPDRKTFVVKRKGNIWNRPIPADFDGREAIFSPDGSKLLFGDGDIWFMEKKGNKWTLPQKFNSNINTESYEYYASMTNDGAIYFSRMENNHPWIFAAKFENGRYSEAVKLPAPINLDSANNFHPFVSPNEDYLIFNSDRACGFGGADLYISFKDINGNWEKSMNLGDKINSDLRDICPIISPDGKYLFFTRNWKENGKWYGDIYWVEAFFLKRINE